MKSISLLDCTLRDGGYVNDWDFGHSVITGTYKRLDAAGVDYIEVGFLDDRREFNINKTIQPNTSCYNEIFRGIEKKNAIPVAMIDYGTCSIENIADCSDTFIDGIRVIFKKEKINEALPFCMAIKEKGYKLFIQAISITAYSDMEMLQYVEKINQIHPFAFSIVDTYGLLNERNLERYFNLINNNLVSDIAIGYHAHNNFQLAFSNTLHFLSFYANRPVIADATVYGMGKSAGNCPIELLSMYMNNFYEKNYDVFQFLEVFDTDLAAIYQKQYWGYKYNFFISAMQNCHPSYVQYLLDKKTLSVSSVNEILSSIPDEQKLLYDLKLIENLYVEYQSRTIDDKFDVERLRAEMSDRNVVILGPGSSIRTQKSNILNFIRSHDSAVISVNVELSDYECGYIFVSNAKRYSKLSDMSEKKSSAKLIVTSNISLFDRKADYILNYSSLLSFNNTNSDNALLLLIAALIKAGVKEVQLAGFDGFSSVGNDYYDSRYSFAGNSDYNLKSNETTIKGLKELTSFIKINFLTDSLYERGLN